MALTQGAWSSKEVNGRTVTTCTITATTAEHKNATLKVPKRMLDVTKPFTLTVNTAGTTLDDATLPVDIYAGYSDAFALSVTTTALTVTDGFLLNADVIADVKAAVGSVIVDPYLNIADDADDIVRGACVPYYGFVLDGAGALAAAACIFVITQ